MYHEVLLLYTNHLDHFTRNGIQRVFVFLVSFPNKSCKILNPIDWLLVRCGICVEVNPTSKHQETAAAAARDWRRHGTEWIDLPHIDMSTQVSMYITYFFFLFALVVFSSFSFQNALTKRLGICRRMFIYSLKSVFANVHRVL